MASPLTATPESSMRTIETASLGIWIRVKPSETGLPV